MLHDGVRFGLGEGGMGADRAEGRGLENRIFGCILLHWLREGRIFVLLWRKFFVRRDDFQAAAVWLS